MAVNVHRPAGSHHSGFQIPTELIFDVRRWTVKSVSGHLGEHPSAILCRFWPRAQGDLLAGELLSRTTGDWHECDNRGCC
jgi:hypothetical protein